MCERLIVLPRLELETPVALDGVGARIALADSADELSPRPLDILVKNRFLI